MAVFAMICFTSEVVKSLPTSLAACSHKATIPAAAGVAIEVPSIEP